MPVVTLDSLRKNQRAQGDSDDEDAGHGNEYYTGGMGQGGSGSGLAVLAPTERGGDASNPLQNFMARLQQEHAQRGAPPPEATSDRRMVTVTVYRNGFTVDNGPLRTLDQPQNQSFMQSLMEGYCPPELVQNGQPADVKLENRLGEDYEPPRTTGRGGRTVVVPANFSAFSGTGSSVGELAESAIPPIVPGTQGSGAPLIVNEAGGDIVRVQIRFPDGAREVAKFEKHHTIRHLIARVELLRPDLRPYHLLSGSRGPPKPIEPSAYDQTLTDAGLAGALVTVKEQ